MKVRAPLSYERNGSGRAGGRGRVVLRGLTRYGCAASLFACWFFPVLPAKRLHGNELPSASSWVGRELGTSGMTVRPAELHSYARAVSAALPTVDLEILGLSTEGRPLLLIRFGAAQRSPERRKVFAVTCGIHSDEVGSSLSGLRLMERLASGVSAALRQALAVADVCLLPCLNPDGQERVALWLEELQLEDNGLHERSRDGGRSVGRLPFLYHRYCGHDLNRDWLLGTQAETRAVVSGLHNRYRPLVTIDLHQMGWSGPRMFLPPYAEPHDPAVPTGLFETTAVLGDAVARELGAVGYTGIAQSWQYDAWSPARAYPFYHGGIRFLIEVASARLASDRYVSASVLHVFDGNKATALHPKPWSGGRWGLREVLDYAIAATETALRVAAVDDLLRSDPGQPVPTVVRLDGLGRDPGLASEFLEALEFGGVELFAMPNGDAWLARDPAWGSGWCRALLLCSEYPDADVRGRAGPYDTSTHDLATLAGLEASLAVPADVVVAERRAAPRRGSLGRAATVGRHDNEAAGWWLSARSLPVFGELADLIELGAVVERVTATPPPDLVPGVTLVAGDFLVAGIPGAVARRLARQGTELRSFDDEAWLRLLSGVPHERLSYPRVEVLRGPTVSRDEGWLRWLLEDYRLRFRSSLPEAFKASPMSDARNRVLLVAERLRLAEDPGLELAVSSFVAAGGRVIALGRAARACTRFGGLGLKTVVPFPYLPGTALATKRSARPREVSDPLLWGYSSTPPVFYRGGPLWRVGTTTPGPAEVLLSVDVERSPQCGLGALPASEPGSELAAAVRVRGGEGEWVLFGFQPQLRAWPKSTFRLLFNAIFAPR